MVRYQVVVDGRTFEIEIRPDGQVWVNRQPLDVDLEGIDGLPQYSLLVDHRSYETHVEAGKGGKCRVVVAGHPYQTSLGTERQPEARAASRQRERESATISAPLPGLVVGVRATEGQRVKEGDVVVVIESMKMNMEISAPRSGVVEALDVAVGQEVCHGEILAVIRGDEPGESP